MSYTFSRVLSMHRPGTPFHLCLNKIANLNLKCPYWIESVQPDINLVSKLTLLPSELPTGNMFCRHDRKFTNSPSRLWRGSGKFDTEFARNISLQTVGKFNPCWWGCRLDNSPVRWQTRGLGSQTCRQLCRQPFCRQVCFFLLSLLPFQQAVGVILKKLFKRFFTGNFVKLDTTR